MLDRVAVLNLDLVGVRIRIETTDQRMRGFFETLWEPFLSDDAVPVALIEVRNSNAAETWELKLTEGDRIEITQTSDPWWIALRTRAFFSEIVAREASGVVAIHAAALAWQGQGVLIVGASGSGKSSLARILATLGWRYMG